MRIAKAANHVGSRRPGIILILVLALLTLFAIVGIAFAVYADTARPGNRQFRAEAGTLSSDTTAMADELAPDILRVQFEFVDFRPHLDEIDRLDLAAASLETRVRDAYGLEGNPRFRNDQRNLSRRIAVYRDELDTLRCLILEIQRRQ